jgi:hypothetical protein
MNTNELIINDGVSTPQGVALTTDIIEMKKQKVRATAASRYLRLLTEYGDEYRELLNDKSKARQQLERNIKIETGNYRRPGRPAIYEPKIKKSNGRPRKYIIEIDNIKEE